MQKNLACLKQAGFKIQRGYAFCNFIRIDKVITCYDFWEILKRKSSLTGTIRTSNDITNRLFLQQKAVFMKEFIPVLKKTRMFAGVTEEEIVQNRESRRQRAII